MADVIAPYGGELVDLISAPEEAEELLGRARALKGFNLSDRAVCDLELIATGGFSPLTTFLGQADYERVVAEMHLADGTLWPLPVTLAVNEDSPAAEGKPLALRTPWGETLGVIDVQEVYAYDKEKEAQEVFGTTDAKHPGVAAIQAQGDRCVSGPIRVIGAPEYFDFPELRRTPAQVREAIAARGWEKVVAFQTRNPLHRAHEELTKRAAAEIGGGLLLHPVVGVTKPGDVDHYTRVRCYQALVDNHYDKNEVILSLLPLAMRMGGPREALWHAIIRRNYGATHFIVGRDHAGPGVDSKGEPFYGPYDAQEMLAQHQDEIGVRMVPFKMVVYLPGDDKYVPVDEVPDGAQTTGISGTQVRDDYLSQGRPLPEWFSRPAVASVLTEANPVKARQGFTVWFTGLSGSGKSTIARALEQRLLALGRDVTILDGDEIRTHLSKGLGFSKEDRDTNIRRVGYVAGQVTRHGGTVIAACISPYREIRDECRRTIGNFIEVFAHAPLEVCESRDVKGLYKLARAGEIKGFTGIDDPYEEPENAEVVVETHKETVGESCQKIFDKLVELGHLPPA